MDTNAIDELPDDAHAGTASSSELVLKGVIVIAGIVGFLGYIRWFQSDIVAGYRVGAAGFAVVFLMLVILATASGKDRHWRSWQLLWHVAVLAAFIVGAVAGPP